MDDNDSAISDDLDGITVEEPKKTASSTEYKPRQEEKVTNGKYKEGPQCAGYETFVQSLFKTGTQRLDPSFVLNSYSNDVPVNNLSASEQLKIDSISDYGKYPYSTTPFAPYSDSLSTKSYQYSDSTSANAYSSYSDSKNDDRVFAGDRDYLNRYRFRSEHMRNLHDAREKEYKEGKKKIMLDYKKFRSSPLSPHLYSGDNGNYVHNSDSRIVGSDFVMLTLRPNDNFMNKIDKVLAEARNVNSWD